jgi:integrase
MPKKAKNGEGTISWRKGIAWVQVSMPRAPGEKAKRPRIPIAGSDKMTPAQLRREARKLAADVRAGRIVFDPKPRKGAVPSPAVVTTVRQLGEQWTSGELFKRYGKVNRLRVKATADIDAWMLKAHAYEVKTRGPSGPAFGDLPVSQVTTDDLSIVLGAHPAELRAKTRGDTYQRLRRLFDLAIFPLRLRSDNPVIRYLRPERDPEKLFCFLYPSEMLALLRGTNAAGKTVVPLGRRVLYALGTYTGQRKGSLFAMRSKHVDFAHGTIASFKTKTGRAQYFVADPGLMAILRAWSARRGAPGPDEPIVTDDDVRYDRKRLATALRDDLKAVGVSRALLFEDSAENVEPLRFHDLRSTLCTWARRLGKSDSWIGERTGHELSGDMINRYDRGATTLEDLAYAPFPDVSRAIPELAAMADAMKIVRLTLARLHTPLHTDKVSPDMADDQSKEITDTYESGREDLNLRLLGPEPSALPGCATPRSAAARSRYGERAWRSAPLMAVRASSVNAIRPAALRASSLLDGLPLGRRVTSVANIIVLLSRNY